MALATITFYNVVLFVHVTSVIVAFGPTFGYPIIQAVIERAAPRALPALIRGIQATDRSLLTPGMVLILLTGIYLVVDGPFEWGDAFVSVGLAVIIVLLAISHGYLVPQDRKLLAIAERDVAAAGDGDVRFSEEYRRLSRRFARIGSLLGLLVLVAVFFMVVKP